MYQPWLPSDAVNISAIYEEVSAAITGWSARWFPDLKINVTEFCVGAAIDAQLIEERPNAIAKGIDLRMTRNECDHLLSQLLGADVPIMETNNAGTLVLDRLLEDCLSDLSAAMTDIFDGAADSVSTEAGVSGETVYRANLVDQNDIKIGLLFISRAAIIAFSKRRIPQTKAEGEIVSRWLAVDDTKLEVDSRVGGATISFSDLEGIQIGDVIALDRGLTDKVDLSINHRMVARQSCWLDSSHEGLSLVLDKQM